MPHEKKHSLLLDQIPELKRMRQLAERLGTAMAGNLPGGVKEEEPRRQRKPRSASPLEHAVALVAPESDDPG